MRKKGEMIIEFCAVLREGIFVVKTERQSAQKASWNIVKMAKKQAGVNEKFTFLLRNYLAKTGKL